MYGFIEYSDKNNYIDYSDTSFETFKTICINGVLSIFWMIYGFASMMCLFLLILKFCL